MANTITFLDCTLRDGGYYNNWDFNVDKAVTLLQALNKAGVDIIEVGYKSKLDAGEYFGLFKYCNEEYLNFLHRNDTSDYAFMIDVKEFMNGSQVDTAALDKVIRPTGDSIFTWVRLASHYATISAIEEFTNYFRSKGYKVGFNLMGGSLLSQDQLLDGITVAKKADVDVFYLADSFGSFYPDDIRSLVRFIKANYSGVIGIHTHDNQGLAYANTWAAIEEGVEFVDGTVTGMGRGAGNLQTEQFLLGYSNRTGTPKYTATSLMPVIDDYIEPLKQKFKWGYNLTYMYSGLMNIHPTYCQKLAEGNQFTPQEQALILADIPREFRSKFDKNVLEQATARLLQTEISSPSEGIIKNFDTSRLQGDSCIIFARGQEGANNITSIKQLAAKGIPILECNPTGYFTPEDERYVVILNHVRLTEWLNQEHKGSKAKVILGMPDVAKGLGENVTYYPFKIGEFSTEGKELVFPDFDAGLYAIALAIRCGFRNLYLAGFDGFDSQERNISKDAQFNQIWEKVKGRVNIQFITPTKYRSFARTSIYAI